MPKSIRLFEQLMFAVVGLGFISFVSQYPAWSANLLAAVITLFMAFGFTIILTLLISRKQSNIARWVSIVLYVIGTLFGLYGLLTSDHLSPLGSMSGLPEIIAILQILIQGYATYLLLLPDSVAWTEKKPIPVPSDQI